MGLGTVLLRLGLYGGLASTPLYFYAQSIGFERGQVDGFRKGYVVCEQIKNDEIEKFSGKICSYLKKTMDDAKLQVDEVSQDKDKLKAKGLEGLTDEQIREQIRKVSEQERQGKLQAKR